LNDITGMKKIRWGILGTGRIARSFAEDLQWVANGELVAVASRHAASADEFARNHGVARVHTGADSLMADDRVDAVYVATPHSHHLANSVAALRAGKSVLCEKPLTLNPAECRTLLAAARETRGYLMEGMWTYFLPAIRQAVAWVRAGRIGRVRHIQADFGYPQLPYDPARREYDVVLGGGCLLEMGIYPIALAWLFQSADPEEIKVVARRAPNGVEDDLAMLWRYPDSTATLGTSFRGKLRNWAYVIGDEGYIAIPDFWRAKEAIFYQLDACVECYRDNRDSHGFNYEIAAVGDDLIHGRTQSEVVPWATSLKFQEQMERVRSMMD
jgi:predicted dehydrogenase